MSRSTQRSLGTQNARNVGNVGNEKASRDLLVLAAFQPELEPLRAVLGERLEGRVGELDVRAAAVGIGLARASVGASLSIAEARPSAVVLVGTCGAYGGAPLRIGDVVVARRILLVEPAAVDGAVEFPESMATAMETDEGMRSAIAASGAVVADVATTLGVTVDDAVAARVAKATGAAAEHLEAFGVAIACGSLGVPLAVVLGVANVVGSRARDEWKQNHRSAAGAAIDVVKAWLA
jgi:futalosine hydrolase